MANSAIDAMLPEISVVVTNRNYRKYLPECLDSIYEQTFKSYEVIVVDDASGDDSVHYLTRRRDIDCLIVLNENRGTSAASNIGVQAARGKYCVLVNADDAVRSDFLEKTYAALCAAKRENPKTAFAYTDFWHKGVGHDGKIIDNGVQFPDYSFETLKQFNFILASALFEKKVFEEVGGFQIDYGLEDYDLWLRMGLAGYSGVHVPEYLYQYRAHASNRSTSIDAGAVSDKIRKRLGIGDKPKRLATFALCYTTKRPWMVESVCKEWISKASKLGLVDFYVTYDDDTVVLPYLDDWKAMGLKVFCQNVPPFNCVKGWNLAAEKSEDESILIMVSDDFLPPAAWDEKLINIEPINWFDDDYVVAVNDGNNSSVDRPLTIPIITRKRYQRFGYVYHPTYESLFCDTELTTVARSENRVIDAKTILFDHRHPTCFKRTADIVDAVHASPERWASGQANYTRRSKLGFPINEKTSDEKLWCFDDTLDVWKAYVQEVRPVVYAISHELSTWLKRFLELNTPTSILDLGSNFSAYIAAKYASESSKSVTLDILDTDADSLSRTKKFIEKRIGSQKTTGSVTPSWGVGHLPKESRVYDLVFVDIGDANDKARYEIVVEIVNQKMLAKDGVIVLDDGHFLGVQNINDTLKARGWTSVAPKATFDRYDRFAFVLHESTTTKNWP